MRGDYPRNLVVYKVKGTDKLGCRYLPAVEEDTRPNQGRNKSGKRKYMLGRTGSDDPIQAGKQAITRNGRRAEISISLLSSLILGTMVAKVQ